MRLSAVWGTSPTDIWIGGDTGLMLRLRTVSRASSADRS